MVIEIETNLNPLELLEAVKTIETRTGRDLMVKKNMPRTLDMDILTDGNLLIRSNLLDIPHPKISERRFVLKPWYDIAPDYVVPNINKSITELLKITADKSLISMILIIDKEGSI